MVRRARAELANYETTQTWEETFGFNFASACFISLDRSGKKSLVLFGVRE